MKIFFKEVKCPHCGQVFTVKDDFFENKLNEKNTLYKTEEKPARADLPAIVCGKVYGTDSRTVYEKFCDTLGWDISKADKFGFGTPRYAENCDADRTSDVWFIFCPNYDQNKLDTVVDDCRITNLILNNTKNILEIVDEKFDKKNTADRITFVKTIAGYEFLGVYGILADGTTRVYDRISATYPIER
ncbi:MAG: hypothetical protein IJR61_02055 [Clostridia bacterium]|nr:hypothetical protein [Clostridia bacterium]